MTANVGTTPKGAAQREGILSATREVIREEGLDGVRSEAVSRRSGCSTPLIHYYFPTLDDLILATYLWDEAGIWDPFDAVRAEGDPVELLGLIAAGSFEGGERAARDDLRFWVEYSGRAVFDPAVREPVARRLRRWGDAMEELLRRAQADGAVPGDLDTRAASLRFAGTMGGWAALFLLDAASHQQVAREVRAAIAQCATWRRVVDATPVKPPRPRREPAAADEDRRAAILDAALMVIAERGSRHTEFRAIAEAAGVSAALPRYYHRTMGELHEAMLLHGARRAGERAAAAAAPFDDPRERVRALLLRELEGADAHRRLTAANELLRLGYADPALRAAAVLPLHEAAAVIAAEIAEAQARGLVADGVEPAAAALRLVALRTGLAMGWLVGVVDRGEYTAVVAGAIDDELRPA